MKNPSISGMPSVSIHLRYELFFRQLAALKFLVPFFPSLSLSITWLA